MLYCYKTSAVKRFYMLKKVIFIILALFFINSCGGGGKESKEMRLAAPPKGKIYFGAFPDFGGSEDIVTAERIENFENIAQKRIVWAMFSDNWFKKGGISYPKVKIHTIYNSGALPYVRFMPRSNEEQFKAEKKFSLQNIINGKFDKQLHKWAKDAKADNIPLLADFAVEPNGDWFGWSGVFNGGAKTDGYGDLNYPDGPERFRDAYRHIIDIFREEGVKNITWFFHFNYESFPDEEWNQPKYYYPGDDYIDWVGFSLYGAQTISEDWEDLKFSTQLKDFSSSFKALKTKRPIALLEFGVTDGHPDGNKSEWLKDAFNTIISNPYVKFDAISIWHENWENEDGSKSTLRLDSSEESKKTFRELIKNSCFISNGVINNYHRTK